MPTCTYLQAYCRNGWMDDLRFYVIFNSISVIQPIYFADPSGQGPKKKKKKKKKKERKRLANGKRLRTRPCTDYICAQQVLVTPPGFADIITRIELRGASWKLLKFYPMANVTE